MEFLQKQLGKRISALELSQFLGVDIKIVRRDHVKLGGRRIGRRIVFFEKEVLHALQAGNQGQDVLERRRYESRRTLLGKPSGGTVYLG